MPARPIRRWLAWVVVNGLGGLLACPLGGAIFLLGTVPLLRIWPSDAVRPPVAVVATLAWGLSWPLLAGAGVSSAQWLLLHRSVPDLDLRGWALRGALLWLGGSVAAGLVLYAIEMGSGAGRGSLAAVLQVGLAGLALGVVVGVGQWATLDGRLPDAYLWLGLVPLGYALGAAGAAALAELLWISIRPLGVAAQVLAIAALGGGVGGCIGGAVSGVVLARHPPAPR